MVDLRPFQAAIKQAMEQTPSSDPRGAFMNVLLSAGYKIRGGIKTDEIVRLDSPYCKPNKKTGWYIYREISSGEDGELTGFGYYGCWKEGERIDWQSKLDHLMSTQERLRFHTMREAMRQEIERQKLEAQEEAAQRAFELWQSANDAQEHPYLTLKGVTASPGLKIGNTGLLIIPVHEANQIISLQTISDNGEKRFLSGGKTKGGYFKIEGDDTRIFVAEGYATAKSLNMATGNTAYCAFSCHNLFETATAAQTENPDSIIVVAGDHGNGSKDAINAAQALSVECVFPADEQCKDFNDYHAKHGLDRLKNDFNLSQKNIYVKPDVEELDSMPKPTGFIADCYNYYNACSGIEQKGWAMQTALAIASVVLGRSFKSDYNNYTSLYFICVGKSGTGKETPKTVIESVLTAGGLSMLIAGDGYTSSGAVFTALLDKPRHITIIDEFGRYLEAGKEGKGTHNQREANTKIMESFGRGHSVIRPMTYSAMTASKEAKDAIKNRHVYNPAITLVGMTTPDTFFNSVDRGAIKDGFINRFIISISDAERQVRYHRPHVQVPERIIEWIGIVQNRYGKYHSASEPGEAIVIEFAQEAYDEQIKFQQFCIDQANSLERFGMAEITGRANEIAMRIALICALSDNPMANKIELRHMKWGIAYIKHNLLKIINPFKMKMSGSDYEAQKKIVLAALRNAGADGITWRDMNKTEPFSAIKQKELREILAALKDAELAADEPLQVNGRGRPTVKWIALK